MKRRNFLNLLAGLPALALLPWGEQWLYRGIVITVERSYEDVVMSFMRDGARTGVRIFNGAGASESVQRKIIRRAIDWQLGYRPYL